MPVDVLRNPSRLLSVLAVTVLILLSGCAGKNKSTPEQTLEATFSDTTGAIRGTLLSLDEVPVVGAAVGLLGAGIEPVTTNDAGVFVFSDMAPDTYIVEVSALGYKPATHEVDVIAGEIVEFELTLQDQALEGVGFQRVFGPINGKFFCGFGSAVSGPCKAVGFTEGSAGDPVEDTWASLSGGENNIFQFYHMIEDNKTVESDVLKTLVVEVTWTPTSAGAKWLQASVEDTPKDEDGEPSGRNLSEPIYAATRGENPLRLVVTPGVEHETGEIAMPVNWPGFGIGVFPSADPTGPSVENPNNGNPIYLSPSAYTDQPFQIWITLFYNQEAPLDYTILP